MLEPKYPWEETCTEGASIVEHDGKYYMFYAGACTTTARSRWAWP